MTDPIDEEMNKRIEGIKNQIIPAFKVKGTTDPTESGATERPWKVHFDEVQNPVNGGLIADCFDNHGDAHENAELIVKAVNAYDDHVRIIKRLVEALENNVKTFGCLNSSEIEKDQWQDCGNCCGCDSVKALALVPEEFKS